MAPVVASAKKKQRTMQRLTVHFWTEVKLGAQEWGVGKRLEKKRGREREPVHVTSRSQACRWTDCGADASLYQTQPLHRQGKWLGPVMTSTGQEADKRIYKKKRRIWDQIHKKWTLKAGHYLWWSWHAWQVNTQTPLAKDEKFRVRCWQKLL